MMSDASVRGAGDDQFVNVYLVLCVHIVHVNTISRIAKFTRVLSIVLEESLSLTLFFQ